MPLACSSLSVPLFSSRVEAPTGVLEAPTVTGDISGNHSCLPLVLALTGGREEEGAVRDLWVDPGRFRIERRRGGRDPRHRSSRVARRQGGTTRPVARRRSIPDGSIDSGHVCSCL